MATGLKFHLICRTQPSVRCVFYCRIQAPEKLQQSYIWNFSWKALAIRSLNIVGQCMKGGDMGMKVGNLIMVTGQGRINSPLHFSDITCGSECLTVKRLWQLSSQKNSTINLSQGQKSAPGMQCPADIYTSAVRKASQGDKSAHRMQSSNDTSAARKETLFSVCSHGVQPVEHPAPLCHDIQDRSYCFPVRNTSHMAPVIAAIVVTWSPLPPGKGQLMSFPYSKIGYSINQLCYLLQPLAEQAG